MKIQLVSFDYNLSRGVRNNIVVDIINSSSSDIILFPGHSLRNEDDLEIVKSEIENKHPVAIVELSERSLPSGIPSHNELYMLSGGCFVDMMTSQVFATHEDIDRNTVLVQKFFDELKRRQFECCGKRVTILQCGETSILESKKADSYKAMFRFANDATLREQYESMLKGTDIFLNPIHTIQGEQGIMSQRRIALSAAGRYYFSTACCDEKTKGKLNHKSLQYVCANSNDVTYAAAVRMYRNAISREFSI